MKKLLLAAVLALLLPVATFASGFGYYEHGARATAMAGAYTAVADTVTTIYYNPAGIAFLEGTHINVGMHPVSPGFQATLNGVTTEVSDDFVLPASGYISHRFGDNLAVGVGVFAPYGLEVEWPQNWLGAAIVERVYMATIFVRPTVAYKVNDQFSIAASLDWVYSKIELENSIPFSISPFLPTANVGASIEGDGDGMGFTLSALYKVNEQFNIGVKYQHEVEIEYDGDVAFTPVATGMPLVDGTVAAVFTDQSVGTTVTMPSEFLVGLMYKPTDKLILSSDVQYTGWSSYEDLEVEFERGLLEITSTGDWDDSWMVRLGGEYRMTREWAVRAGYIRDTTPIPDENLHPLLPDADRNEVTAGFGYDTREACCWGGWSADFAIQYIMFEDRVSEDPEFPAAYNDNDALIFGASVGIRF
jgi:long-chain fatty acid transport protein